jgi:hypothetical protein
MSGKSVCDGLTSKRSLSTRDARRKTLRLAQGTPQYPTLALESLSLKAGPSA